MLLIAKTVAVSQRADALKATFIEIEQSPDARFRPLLQQVPVGLFVGGIDRVFRGTGTVA